MRARGHPALACLFIVAVAFSAFCQTENPIPFLSLISQPDHSDMQGSLQIGRPTLTYNQRYLVEVSASIPASALSADARFLHFMLKVQDGSGNWLPGEEYNRYQLQRPLGGEAEIICSMFVYLPPGEYVVAMVAYETTSKKANVKRQKIIVSSISKTPSPELDSLFPHVEFPHGVPGDRVWSVPRELPDLVLRRTNPVRVDILLSVFDRHFVKYTIQCKYELELTGGQICDPAPSPSERAKMDSAYAEKELSEVLGLASIVSRFSPSNGCSFVTVVDPFRKEIRVPSKATDQIDWLELKKSLAGTRPNSITQPAARQAEPGKFMHSVLTQITDSGATCNGKSVAAHIVVVISWPLHLPKVSSKMLLAQSASDYLKLYYFRPAGVGGVHTTPLPDDLERILHSADAKVVKYSTPAELRKGLTSLISDVRALGE